MLIERRRLTLAERLYLPQVLGGLAVTTRHFARNLVLHTLHLFGLAKARRAAVTVQYPEERKVYSDGYRGAHRLTLKPDGSVRYEIDTLQCIYCGMCVEACPCDAIRMDTHVHPRIWGYRREDFVESKAVLMGRSRVLAERGRDALMEDQLRFYAEAEVAPESGERPALPEAK